MSRTPAIAPALAGDIDAVMAVMTEAFDPMFGEAWSAAQCLGMLGLPGVWMLLARRDGEAAGFALSRVILDEAELLLLAVRPAFRGGGIGGALLDRVMLDAASRGAAKFHLEVRAGNAAMGLYHARGLQQTGRRPAYYKGKDGSIHDALSLSARL